MDIQEWQVVIERVIMPELKENKIEAPEQLSVQSEDNFEFQEEVEDFVLIDKGEISPSDESGYIRKKGLLKLAARRKKGFKSYDFITEIKSYLKIITSLLNTESGLYLCGFFARKVSQAKDPIIAGSLARLVEIVNDRGGKHIFIWHTMRLLSRKKADQPGYLSFVEENNGCDPGYPRIDRIIWEQD